MRQSDSQWLKAITNIATLSLKQLLLVTVCPIQGLLLSQIL